jgi:hypothetical protein
MAHAEKDSAGRLDVQRQQHESAQITSVTWPRLKAREDMEAAYLTTQRVPE